MSELESDVADQGPAGPPVLPPPDLPPAPGPRQTWADADPGRVAPLPEEPTGPAAPS